METEQCPWCLQRYDRADHRLHMRTHLVQIERYRQEIHGEVEPVDRVIQDLTRPMRA